MALASLLLRFFKQIRWDNTSERAWRGWKLHSWVGQVRGRTWEERRKAASRWCSEPTHITWALPVKGDLEGWWSTGIQKLKWSRISTRRSTSWRDHDPGGSSLRCYSTNLSSESPLFKTTKFVCGIVATMKIPWGRKWQPTPAFCLGNPRDRGAWWVTVHGVTKELDMTEWLNNNNNSCVNHWPNAQPSFHPFLLLQPSLFLRQFSMTAPCMALGAAILPSSTPRCLGVQPKGTHWRPRPLHLRERN